MLARYRNLATPLALVAAVILVYMENPWFFPKDGTIENDVATVAFWVLTIVVLILMFEDRKSPGAEVVNVEGPAFARYLFSNTTAGLFWLPIRIFLGFEWAVAGWHKLSGAGWIDGGGAILGYWQKAVAVPAQGSAPITFDWYRSFLQLLIDNHAQGLFGWLIAVGELAVGSRPPRRGARRGRGLLRGGDEHVLPARRFDVVEPGHVRACDRPDPGLEGGRVLRRRPLPPAAPRRALAGEGGHPESIVKRSRF